MGLLARFDLSSDFTRFFLGGFLFLMVITLLLSWVSPKNKEKRRARGKVDDRFISMEGELID